MPHKKTVLHTMSLSPETTRLLEAVKKSGASVLSVDIFDTVLTRSVARPTDLFVSLGHIVRARSLTDLSAERFARLRKFSESQTRASTEHREPSLEEIYRTLSLRLGWTTEQTQTALELELECERAAIVPLPPMIASVVAARTAGLKIVFVSDMYLPGVFLRELLTQHGIALEEDLLFVSNEQRASKFSGKLFEKVVATLKVSPSSILHWGNDHHSDFNQPRKVGLHALHLDGTDLNFLENLHVSFSPELHWLPSEIAAASKRARLTCANNTANPALAAIGAGLLGPILTLFVIWLFDRAKAAGIRRLYFVSRDGQVILQVARVLQSRCRKYSDIECRYLYGSRIAWHHASLHSLSPRHLRWLLNPQPVLNRDILAQRLRIKAEQLTSLLRKTQAQRVVERSSWDAEAIALVQASLLSVEAELLNLVGAAERVACAQTYLHQEGLFDEIQSGIVELGWSGSMLTSLHHALGEKKELRAFYLCQSSEDSELPAPAQIKSFLIQPRGAHETTAHHLRIAEMLEALTAADHPTVLGYKFSEKKILPELKDGTVAMWKPEALAALRRGAEGFAESISEATADALSVFLADSSKAHLAAIYLQTVLARFVATPPLELAQPFTECSYSEDPADEHRRMFASPLTFSQALSATPFPEGTLWPQGSLAVSSGTAQALAGGGLCRGAAYALRRVFRRIFS